MIPAGQQRKWARRPGNTLAGLGDQLSFYGRTFGSMYRAFTSYKREIVRLLAEIAMGSGGLAVVGGTVTITAVMTVSSGAEVGLQGFSILNQIGVDAMAGFASAFLNTREAAPLIAGVGLAATVGAGFTAQLGAMRVNEEIDALEVMAIPSIPYLVSTRIAAGFIAIIPLYATALITSYASAALMITVLFGQADGTYQHYFSVFLLPADVLWSLCKAMLMALVVMLVHCYYGYRARGGPAGVGQAVGNATRASLVGVVLVDLLVGLAVYGGGETIHISG